METLESIAQIGLSVLVIFMTILCLMVPLVGTIVLTMILTEVIPGKWTEKSAIGLGFVIFTIQVIGMFSIGYF